MRGWYSGISRTADTIQGRVDSSPVEILRDGCLPAECGVVLDPTEPAKLFVATDDHAQVCQKADVCSGRESTLAKEAKHCVHVSMSITGVWRRLVLT